VARQELGHLRATAGDRREWVDRTLGVPRVRTDRGLGMTNQKLAWANQRLAGNGAPEAADQTAGASTGAVPPLGRGQVDT
jgi:hypothetical protein